jgi:hypothetical protein
MKLMVIKPEDVARGSAFQFSNEIINTLREDRELAVVGFGNAVALACMAVQLSSNLANVSAKEISLDYVGAPALRIGAVMVVLGRDGAVPWERKGQELDSKMKLDFSREGQIIVISKNLSPDQVVPLSLAKLARSDYLKITAAGVAINRAVPLALELSKGNIARFPIGIELVILTTIEMKKEAVPIQGTGMQIYLRKGAYTTYSPKHKEILKLLETK